MFKPFSEEFDGKIRLTTTSGTGPLFFKAEAELPGDAKPEHIKAAWDGILDLQKNKLSTRD